MSESDPAPAPSNEPAPGPAAGGGKAIGTIAALLALAAIGAAGFVYTEVQKLQVLPQQLQAGDGRTQQLRSEIRQQLTQLGARVADSEAGVAELQGVIAGEVAALAELSLSVEQMGDELDSVTGTDRSRRNRFLQAEALYFMRVANARALLAGDAAVALEALELADGKLRETGDPELTPVRARLAEEIAALRAIPDVDVTGMAFSLQSLSAQVDSWPIRNPAPERFAGDPLGAEPAANAEAGEMTAWQRFLATVDDVFSSIVKVRDNTEAPAVQLSQAQHALVIQSVRAEVQVARLALVTGEYELYAQSLARIDTQLNGYFDTGDSAVQAALETVAALAAAERPAAMPDISGSLALLLNDAATGDDADVADATGEAQ